MRAAIVDARPVPAGIDLCPAVLSWTLTGGAVLDGDQIVLPAIGATAKSPFIKVDGPVSASYVPQALVPAGGSNFIYATSEYYGYDQVTRVNNTAGNAGNGLADALPSADSWLPWPFGMSLGPNIQWMRIYHQVTTQYGVPGTRIRPQNLVLTR